MIYCSSSRLPDGRQVSNRSELDILSDMIMSKSALNEVEDNSHSDLGERRKTNKWLNKEKLMKTNKDDICSTLQQSTGRC